MLRVSRPQIVVLVLAALIAAALGAVFRKMQLAITETQIIDKYAASYLATNPKGDLTQCSAVPGRAYGVRLVVICGPGGFDPSQHYEYHVGALGGLVRRLGPADWPTETPLLGADGT
ncbi:hypothetical protein [Litoreibacter roseus]|uniref:Uncharacterized protein n=1 Tax=Litoreibacter roseus TaxID=2601869 RepID=A0A6N6JK32_9RHOB|nr:hypothetical protein [Litoreibacter roseus]GFE65779.1 hypothetical protein KIN_28530 [Litoreibacter roseus]